MESRLDEIEVLHNRVPKDSPFNREGRDVCGTCMDGHQPADWPCPTISVVWSVRLLSGKTPPTAS